MGELHKIAAVKKIVEENENARTIYLDYNAEFLPGQFYMFWLLGADEKPFVFSSKGKISGFTARLKGKFTKKIFELKEGGKIGVRGPYGNWFNIEKVKKACIVAGGIGAAPTVTLAEELKKRKAKVITILGARNKGELLFEKRFGKCGKLYITTDDGSAGTNGNCTDKFWEILKKEKFDMVYGCGPELMLKKLFEMCEKKKVKCQLSLERYIKCGFGICGQCTIDGLMVCRDGPVFDSAQLGKLGEFGKYAYLKSSRKVPLQEFSAWRQK